MSTLDLAGYDIFLAKLDKADFSAIARLLKNQGWKPKQIAEAISDYCKYLFLTCQNPGQALTPTQGIDSVLHAHMLSDQFEQDCRHVLGGILNHESGGIDAANQRAAFQRTKNLFRTAFGTELTDAPSPCVTKALASV